jgi:glycosyltransferase involved in cell wall biosynthesis
MQNIEIIVSSGGPFHAYHLVRGAQQAGYLKRFITGYLDPREPGIDRSRVKQILLAEAVGQALWRLPGAGTLYFSYLLHDNLFDLLARRYVDGGDVFHVFNHFGLWSMRKARRLGMKTIIERSSAHPVFVHRLLAEEYERFGLRFPTSSRWIEAKHLQEYAEADAIMVPSSFVWRTMVEQGIPESKLRRVHFGFAPERFAPLPGAKTDNVFRVIFVGTVSLQKGVQYLLEAFQRLNLPNAELVFVGSSFRDSQSFLRRYEGLYRQIPFVPQEKLPELYRTASVFVLPSLQDGFGMVVYEAAACGLPVIITENVGAEIRDGQDGYIVPIRDPDTLSDRLLRLYQDDHLRRVMGESARLYVQQFAWQGYHHELAEHYRRCVES